MAPPAPSLPRSTSSAQSIHVRRPSFHTVQQTFDGHRARDSCADRAPPSNLRGAMCAGSDKCPPVRFHSTQTLPPWHVWTPTTTRQATRGRPRSRRATSRWTTMGDGCCVRHQRELLGRHRSARGGTAPAKLTAVPDLSAHNCRSGTSQRERGADGVERADPRQAPRPAICACGHSSGVVGQALLVASARWHDGCGRLRQVV